MSFFVSRIRCADGSYYTGHSDDFEVRIAAHHGGDIPYRGFRVIGSDPHRFDADGDGVGCES